MVLSRVASMNLTTKLMSDNMRLQAGLANTQAQLSTGLKSFDYKGISRDARKLLSLESAKDQLQAYNDNGTMVLNQVEIAFTALGGIEDMGNTVLKEITAALSGDLVDPVVTTNMAQTAMQELASLLNRRVGDRYIFGGIDIDTLPVDLAAPAWTAQTPPSSANSAYYQGSTTKLSVQLSETLTLDYSLLADDPCFEKMFRALNLIVNNVGNRAAYSEALGLMTTGMHELGSARSALSSNAATIENQNLRNSEDMSNLAELITNVKQVDIPTATVQLKAYETQIEASYSASVSLLRLSLTNFL